MPCRYRARPKIPLNGNDVHLQLCIFNPESIVRAFPCFCNNTMTPSMKIPEDKSPIAIQNMEPEEEVSVAIRRSSRRRTANPKYTTKTKEQQGRKIAPKKLQMEEADEGVNIDDISNNQLLIKFGGASSARTPKKQITEINSLICTPSTKETRSQNGTTTTPQKRSEPEYEKGESSIKKQHGKFDTPDDDSDDELLATLLPTAAKRWLKMPTETDLPQGELQTTSLSEAHPNLIDPIFKARISGKWCGEIFGNERMMMLTLIDIENKEIQMSNEEADLDRRNEELQIGEVYTIQHAQVIQSKRRFQLTPHQFFMNITTNTIFQKMEDDNSIPLERYYIRPLDELHNAFATPEILIDVVGSVARCDTCRQIVRKNGAITNIFGVYIIDKSKTVAKLTLWGEIATKHANDILRAGTQNQYILATKLNIGTFRGNYTLNSTYYTKIIFNPKGIMETTSFDNGGEQTIPNIDEKIQQLHNGGRQCKVDDQITIKDLLAGIDSANLEKKHFVIAGTISNFKFNEGIWYSACHSCYSQYQTCLHTKQCNKCKIHNSNMIKRPRLKVEVKDKTCQIDITLFGRDAELVMGVPLTKLMPVDGKEISRIELEDILNVRLQRKYIFNISVTPKNVTYAKKKSFTATSVVEA